MTIAQLIRRLHLIQLLCKLPPSTPVLVQGYETDYDDISHINISPMTPTHSTFYAFGEYKASETGTLAILLRRNTNRTQ